MAFYSVTIKITDKPFPSQNVYLPTGRDVRSSFLRLRLSGLLCQALIGFWSIRLIPKA